MKVQNPNKKWVSLIIITSIITLIFILFREDALNLLAQLNLQALKANYSDLQIYFKDHPVQLSLIYALIYILVTALSLPGAVILTLAGGAIFGLFLGTILVSFCSTIVHNLGEMWQEG